jgi:8-oxo-dGTP pyrophosphatase MutT (NUDIX family)
MHDLLFEDDSEDEFDAAVGIVRCHDKWLLGLAKDTNDDRELYWTFPGGGIKSGETEKAAAVREVREETGVKCRAISGPIKDKRKKRVAFIACTTNSSDHNNLKPNHEYITLGFFTVREMKTLRLYNNVLDLIEKAKRR